MLCGYKLVDANGAVIESWGGHYGELSSVPNPIRLPNGVDVFSPKLDEDYGGFRLVGWDVPAPALNESDYAAEAQREIDAAARSRGYTDGVSLATYTSSTNQIWAAEAQAFIAWRDTVWASAYAQLAAVMSGQQAQPSLEEFRASLPEMAWPE